jgi:hypothetical protein
MARIGAEQTAMATLFIRVVCARMMSPSPEGVVDLPVGLDGPSVALQPARRSERRRHALSALAADRHVRDKTDISGVLH